MSCPLFSIRILRNIFWNFQNTRIYERKSELFSLIFEQD